jgi:hypothetical protein
MVEFKLNMVFFSNLHNIGLFGKCFHFLIFFQPFKLKFETCLNLLFFFFLISVWHPIFSHVFSLVFILIFIMGKT